MVRVTFDRPALDGAWTEKKRAGASPREATPLQGPIPCATALNMLNDLFNASELAFQDDHMLASTDIQAQKRPIHFSSDDAMFNEQAAVLLDDDRAGQEQEQEQDECLVVVKAEAEPQNKENDQESQLVALPSLRGGHSSEESELQATSKMEEPKLQQQEDQDQKAITSRKRPRIFMCLEGLAEFAQARFGRYKVALEDEAQRVMRESASLHEVKAASAAQARERLGHVMDKYHAKAQPVEGDGNCQFRALSQQLHGDQNYHGDLRARVVEQLKTMPERYENFVLEPYTDYVTRMSQGGEWGDNVTLQAASDKLGRNIQVLTDMEGADCIQVHPSEKMSEPAEKPLCLTFLTEVHYDAAELP